MCLLCKMPTYDNATTEEFSGSVVEIYNHAALALMFAVGHRTRLFDTMAELLPSTSLEIAQAAGLNERYVREWLGAMVTGRIIQYHPEKQAYSLPVAHAAALTRKSAPNNLAAISQFISVLGSNEDRIVECFEQGGGVSYAEFPRFQSVMMEESGQTVLPALIEAILPLPEGLVQRLEKGISVLEVGFGMGRALNLMAERFPNSSFVGYEISSEGVFAAQAQAAANGLTNVEFVIQDAATFNDVEKFDFICSFDAIHDQADPARVLRNIWRALAPGGSYLMQDIDAHSEVAGNIDHPLGPFFYTISCLHCMTVSLAANGAGLGAVWGVQLAESMLRQAGFSDVSVNRLPHDVQNAYFVSRK